MVSCCSFLRFATRENLTKASNRMCKSRCPPFSSTCGSHHLKGLEFRRNIKVRRLGWMVSDTLQIRVLPLGWVLQRIVMQQTFSLPSYGKDDPERFLCVPDLEFWIYGILELFQFACLVKYNNMLNTIRRNRWGFGMGSCQGLREERPHSFHCEIRISKDSNVAVAGFKT